MDRGVILVLMGKPKAIICFLLGMDEEDKPPGGDTDELETNAKAEVARRLYKGELAPSDALSLESAACGDTKSA